MSVFEFLSSLNSLNIKVWIEDDQLRYRAPKGVMTSAIKQELLERKAEILSCLQEAKTAKKLAFSPILPIDRDCHLPLSFSQQRMWFLNQIDSQNPSYNESFQFQIVGTLNVTALEQSINEIIRRHEALRTIFQTVDGLVVQQIVPNLTINIPVVDLQGLEEAEIQQIVTQEVHQPFDLAISPLLRSRLLRLESELHLLILTLHHIIVDGWSMGILIEELSAIYQAFSTGSPILLPELTIQYADFAVWQRKWLTEELQQQQLDYWKQQLADAPPLLELPTDYPRSSVQNFSGAVQKWKLNSHLTAQIKTLSQQSGTTLFVTLLAAFAVLLHRYSRQKDICIGSPFANRNRTEVESLIGCFINTLVLRAQITDNPSFQELLAQVNSVVLDAQANQNVPFERVVEALQPERSLSYNPLFQVMFVLENFSLETLELPGIRLTPEIVERGTAQFDLSLSIWETQNELIGSWEYNSDLFEPDTIARMTGHFQTLLEAIVSDRNLKIGELPLLTPSEQHQLLVEWNNNQADYPSNKCIHQLFEEQVARTPDAVAVVYENQQLTYHELNCRANQLANYLRSLGVGADVLVGLCVKRSPLMVIGLLGILKAGGAYVPLDPEYPTERLSFMVEDAQVNVLLTQQALLEKLANNQRQFICLDTDTQIISQWSDLNLVNTTTPENLAYVIYTSGSTGKPKGVMVEHRSLVNLIAATKLRFAINSSDRVLQFSSISFDSAIEEICHCLSCGGTLVLRTDEMLNSVSTFLQKCQEWKLTVLELPTAYWHQLTSELAITNEGLPTSVRLVIIGGEQVLLEKLKLWQKYIEDRLLCDQIKQPPLLLNGYGPSEATVGVTLCKLSELVLEDTQTRLPIGRPINNVQIYILDSYLQPIPIGMAGELYIGGICLARGYLNATELTAEKFISNPFSNDPNSRLYKTGDLARYLSDGNIEYLGRIDNQVKIRGFRIELGEIETVLSQHVNVQASCVINREDTTGDNRLVAYVVANQPHKATISDLRQFLKAKLPEYMVPSTFVLLESLPLTANGKVDRRALPALDLNHKLREKYVAPRNPNEELLAQIWAQVLKVEQVGIYDNFFTLGGHSLLATQLVSCIRNRFKVELPLRELFATSTLAQLALIIEQLQQQDLGLFAPPILPRAENADLPLSFAQQRLWFLDQLQPDRSFYNIPLALRLVGNLNQVALQQSLIEIIHRHEALRTNFITVDGKPSQIIREQGTVSIVDLKNLSITEQEIATEQLVQQEFIQPFDLATEPLVRTKLVVLSDTEYVLSICMHHVVSDGWSMDVFIQELGALYNAYSQGKPSPLPPLQIQYADFAIWQRQWLQGDVLQSQLEYWQQQLKDAPALLVLPTDRPRPAVQTFAGAHHEFALSIELTQKLVKLSQEQGCTLFMTLLAAYDTLLYRYTGVADILVGTPIANRDRSEIEGLIGFFVNTLVLRTNLAGNPSFSELLSRVREMAMEAYTHQQLPFEMLVEVLQPQRDLSYSPLFQVMFVLQNAPMSDVELTDLNISYLPTQSVAAKFDLTLAIRNTVNGLVGVWEYNTDLFDHSTIERIAGHFVTLLEGIIANPQQQISQLPLLTLPEQHQLLVEWNDTEADYPFDKCIHQLFEEQVERTPDAVAVVFEDQQLTYQQLNSRANQLAHYLRSLGIKPDTLVGICVERSLEMIIGLLGILKAGGAYVPLDPEYPQERLSLMLEDAQVSILLTQKHLIERLPESQVHRVCLDEIGVQIAQNHENNPSSEVTASHLAYVIYTSGSTGKPKGVMVEHKGLCNLAQALIQTFGVGSDSRVLQFTSFSFDVSISEILMAFGSGAALYLGTKDALMPGNALMEKLRHHGITHISLPPSALAVMSVEELPALQAIIVGGEACAVELMKQWSIGRNFFNAYGPTEASVCTTIAKCNSQDEKITIGKGIANVETYILDQYLQPVPIGVPGELHIGGIGLARGYLNRPELTQEKFIVNPFNNAQKLYKTGDLARYLPDGNIEYLGRVDNQVKIRGFRIELGEIEAVLSQHPFIQGSAVIVREDIPGDKRLVGYIVPKKDWLPEGTAIRQFLVNKLPGYMIPSAFVRVEFLPLTPNGKIDRRALPKPELDSTILEKYVAPRNPLEEMLAQTWSQILKVEQIGIYDNFFELGGHSLLATQLVSRIRQSLQVELPLRELFANPTIGELAQSISYLKQQSLKFPTPPILPRPENTVLPLSFAQQRLWFLDQFEPKSALYNIPLALSLAGTLNQVALEQIFQEIIARHEALRTNFLTVDGQASQVVHPEVNWQISVVNLQDLPTTEKEITSRQLVEQQAVRPFDLTKEVLIRATLVVLSETEHLLLVCMHHVVSDGWSIGIFIEELATLYNAYSQGFRERQPNGESSSLTPLSIQYPDFALWQREWLQGEVLQEQFNYWEQQLADAPALLSLPTDRPRPAVQTFAGAHLEFTLSPELSQKLMQLSQEQGVTLFMTLLAAYNTLLYRYTGQEDILVGSPIANRDRSEIEGLIGLFVNTLVMRSNLVGNPSFSELLSRVRDMAMEAYTYQHLPFEMLVEALKPERNLGHTPLFQVMFALENAPLSGVELTGLSITPLMIESATTKFDLTLSMQKTAAGLVGVWEYNTDLFDTATIERMSGHFMILLSGIVDNPEEQISQLPLLKPLEQHQLLVEWNNTEADYPTNKCIHQLFEEQCLSTPDAVAVVFENEQLTYHQLNCRANQLAHYLQSMGIKPDTLVGICVERSLEMVVGLLGILKAGGAYLPLDPEHPQDRLSFVLEDAQVRVLLTQQKLLHKLSLSQVQVVCLDRDWLHISQLSQDNVIAPVQTTNLAYVIYTSGSTGKPKGVQIPHTAVTNFLTAMQQQPGITEQDTLLAVTTIAFDIAALEIFLPITVGASVVIASDNVIFDSKNLLDLLVKSKATLIQATPATWRLILETNFQSSDLKILCGGEALPWDLANQLQARGNSLWNLYGPTETTIWSLVYQVKSQEKLIAIGRPIANTQVYILDPHLQPVPVGVIGELYIGGLGLAKGYLNRPELTLEKFILNPFEEEGGRRQKSEASKLYKTGDLVRYLPDGNIEYLGRIDNQVKIRGFRIELSEIEAVLSQHTDVQLSCIIAREDVPGDKRLVAYVVPHQYSLSLINELRQHLKAKLPSYMIPNAFVILESLPLTPNGKIDRRALPKPESDSTLLEKYVAPRTHIEEILAQIWAQVLKVELVGIHDNFFELGGHSLLATQLVSRIRHLFQVELPLRELFASATVSQLAQVIRQLQQQDLELSTAPILPRVNNTDLPLSFTQQRLWFLDQFEPNSSFYNIPLAFRLVGNLNQAALEQSLQDIIARHEALRTNFVAVDGQPFQIVQPQTNWTVSVVDLKHLSTTEQEIATQELAQQQAIEPFDLARQALIRATLLLLNETEYFLSVCMHHIVSDGWSMGVFSQELADLYNAYSIGQPSPLAPLSIQYADFAIWQRQWLQGDVLQNQLSYWQKQLADAPGLLSLPTDRPRPTVQTYRGAYQEFELSQKLSVALQQLSQKESATLFMMLLAAFQILLWRYSGQDDICVGTPIANRNRAEIEGLIGFFVNTLVLRTYLGDNPSFTQLLSQVREVAIGAYAHQDLPFELLVEKLQLQRDLSHNPIFQVWFNVLNLGDNQLQLSGLSVEPISIPEDVSKFDLSLYVQEQKQGIKLELVYNSDLFNSDTIATMLLHYQTLLESIVANPEQKISTLPLLTKTECYSLKNSGNFVKPSNFFTEFRKQDIEQSIPARFEEQVRKYPDHIAVHTNNYHWTYSELSCRANQVAQAILKQCTSSEERIALFFEHDAPAIAVILGVLKVGKTYVPLDPNYPTERLGYILQDSQASTVITNNKNLGRAQELIKGSIPIVNIDEISFTSSDHQINFKISPDTIAYILYTSGSTGQPKGVIQTHRNVLHFIRNYTNSLHINEQDGLTLLSSYSFDAAIVDIFSAILNGATLYPINIKEEGSTNLFQVLQQQQITIYHSTPTLYRHFIKSLSQHEKLNQIRLVVLGGEEVVRTDVDSYKQHFDEECIFVNCIGSTESSITMLYLLERQTEITRNTVPIGYPVEETEIFLLNQFGEKTDIYGEIAIRSPYIALGYWQKPDLTQAVFLPDPELSSRRIYRTGDLGRLRPDGSLEFLGRKDFQVKIRGFRIELGEIEAAIAQHPSVSETVVIAKEDGSGDKHLVAYIVATQTLTTNEIRHVLKQKLPDYMIPSSFVFLDSLPLTPNGKVNRRALPTPSFNNSSDRFVAPRNQLELQLVQIWSKILKVPQVGVQDNFFDLGGHSLLVPYLIAQIKQQFGKDLPLITLFQNPTIEQLASIVQKDSVQNNSDSSSESVLVAIQPNGSKQPFFCIPGAGAYPFYLYNLASFLDQDQPFYSFQADGLDGKLEPIIGIENIASRYIQALKAVQSQGPYFLGGHSFGGKVAFEIAQQLLRQGHIVALVAIFDAPAPFNRQQQMLADWDHAKWLSEFAKMMEFEFAKNLGISNDTLKSLLPEEQLKYVLERLKMVNILPSDAQPKELSNLLQVLKANALVDYLPQQVYPTPITLFRAQEVSSEELAIKFPSEILEDMTWGWNKFSAEQVNVDFVPGDHLTMMAQPHVQVLAKRLKACIKKARATIL